MKKNYIYPTVESVSVATELHVCAGSPTGSSDIIVNPGSGAPVTGGADTMPPGDAI